MRGGSDAESEWTTIGLLLVKQSAKVEIPPRLLAPLRDPALEQTPEEGELLEDDWAPLPLSPSLLGLSSPSLPVALAPAAPAASRGPERKLRPSARAFAVSPPASQTLELAESECSESDSSSSIPPRP